MKKEEMMKLKGSFTAILRRKDGSVEVKRKDNLILNVGFDFICNAIAATSQPAPMAYTAVGTGTAAVAATQTALATELTRVAATYAHTAGTKVFSLTSFYPAGTATGAITEAGICNASSGGTFLDRVVFDVINKGSDDELTTNFQFTLS